MAFKIVFTGGGTGGHIYPIVAILREIKKQKPKQTELKMWFLGPNNAPGTELLLRENVETKKILSGKWRRYFSLKNIFSPFLTFVGFCQAFLFMLFKAPDLIFSKGGYGSLPVCLAGKTLGIPIVLHESDAIPGAASKMEAKMAIEIFTSFPNTPFLQKDKVLCVGNPVRKEIIPPSDAEFKNKAKNKLSLPQTKPVVLFLGGSQGAKTINDLVLDLLPDALHSFCIVHQTGQKHFESVKNEAWATIGDSLELKRRYKIYGFLDEQTMPLALASADMVVARAGSGTIFEIAASGKPAFLVPLPNSAQNHQLKNAYEFKKWGGGEVIEQRNLRPHFLEGMLNHYLKRKDILEEMSRRSKEFSRPEAARIIAAYLVEFLKVV